MRWILRIVFGLLVLVVAGVVVLFLLPAEKIARVVATEFEAATGRAMTLEGDVRPSLWPELGVRTGRVTIANADWSDAGPMLQAEGLSVGVDMAALFGGTVRIKRVEALAPQIVLETASGGRANWDLSNGAPAASAAGGSSGASPAFTLDEAVITDAAVTFIDRVSGSRTTLSAIDATVRLPDFAGPADFDLSAVMNGQTVALSGRIGSFQGLLDNKVVPVSATTKVGGSRVQFDGRAGMSPLAVGGKLDADLSDMKALFALLGQAAPALPKGLGQSVGVRGDVTYDDKGRLTLRDGTIRLDQNTLTGAADVTLGSRTKVTAQLSAGALDLSALGGTGGGSGAASGSASTGWSKDRIDVSGMQAVDAEVSLAAGSIDLGVAQLGRTRLLTTLENGRAVTEIKELSAYDGAVTGSVVVNSRGGLSTRATLKGDGIAIRPLLKQLAGYDRLLADGTVAINLLGVGNDLNALMNSLSGDGSIRLGQGELQGLDLVGMLRTLDTSYVGAGAKTIFESIGASFTVDKGVLSNDDLAFKAPLLTASGKGTVGIGAQTLNYRLVPTLLEGQNGGKGLRVPLLITGTWAKPKFKLDLESLAQERLDAEADKLKAKAEAELKKKLADELGVTVQDGQKIEDAVKQEVEDRVTKELEDAVGKGLLNLLGGKN